MKKGSFEAEPIEKDIADQIELQKE
jgi:hypothetical protein